MSLRNRSWESIGVSDSFKKRGKRGRECPIIARTIDGASSRGRTCDLSRATAARALRPTAGGRRAGGIGGGSPAALKAISKKFPSLPILPPSFHDPAGAGGD